MCVRMMKSVQSEISVSPSVSPYPPTRLQGAEADAKKLHAQGLAERHRQEGGGHQEGRGVDAEGVGGEVEPDDRVVGCGLGGMCMFCGIRWGGG